MTTWLPMVVLPNIDMRCRVEGRYAVFAGRDDERVIALCKEHPLLEKFLGAFTDAFRRPQRPSLMLIRNDAPESFRHGRAVSALRDAFAISVIPQNRAKSIIARRPCEPLFSNSFDFHPWMIDGTFQRVTVRTPALRADGVLEEFAGQTNPEVDACTVGDVDEPLLDSLLTQWESAFSSLSPNWAHRALFRSLNMATNAARMPFSAIGQFYDYGRLVALWVSAFEILVHNGSGKAGRNEVCHMLLNYLPGTKLEPWKMHSCPTIREWALDHLYSARNDYLHGNPVADDRLLLPGARVDIGMYAALLYRLILTERLSLFHDVPQVAVDMPDKEAALGKAFAKWSYAKSFQEKIEEALFTMTGGVGGQD